MAFPCSLNSPNRELKTKKASRFDWRRLSKNVPIGTLHIGSEADDASYCGTIVKQCFIWKGGIMKHTLRCMKQSYGLWSGACRTMKRKPFQASCFFAFEKKAKKMVAGPGIEPGTQGFSVLCSTDWAIPPHFFMSFNIDQFWQIASFFCNFFNFFHRYPIFFEKRSFSLSFEARNFRFSKSDFVRFLFLTKTICKVK